MIHPNFTRPENKNELIMMNLFKKTWFRVVFFGILIAAALIIFDEKFKFFETTKKGNEIYEGPISIEKDKTYFTEIKILETKYDFGKVKEGDTLMHVFKLTNTGKEPLFIYKVSGSCDCIGAEYPKEMINPGSEAQVKVYFNTKGRKGVQNRLVTITCNTDPADIIVTINAEVE